MALKYEDYAKRQKDDAIEKEIQDAGEKAEKRREIPDSIRKRFDGKDVEDIMESFYHLEQERSRLGQQVGELRKTTDQLIELQLQQDSNPQKVDTTESVEPISSDDFYDNPEEAVGKVIDRKTKASEERVKKLEEQLETSAKERALQDLTTRYEGWQNEVQSDEFRKWVQDSTYRTRMAAAADNYDLDAANDLLELWYERKGASAQEAERKQKRERQLDDAALETSSPGELSSEQTFSRHDLIQKRIRATKGNLEDKEWLNRNADAIALAYEERRITD